MNEEWKAIGSSGKYFVSNKGRVKSIDTNNNQFKISKEYILSDNSINNSGYPHADVDGKKCLVHRMVADKFVDNPENKPFVNHKDGDKTNNKASNLEWVTCSENARHSFEIGLQDNKGENHPSNKLTESIVKQIRQLYERTSVKQKELAKRYGITAAQVHNIVRYKQWTHI